MNVVLIAGDQQMDQFMHAADVFEGNKRLATPQMFSIEGDIQDENRGTVVEKVREASEKMGKIVVACFSPGSPEGAFLDTKVKVISNGEKWTLLDKVLEKYGYVGGQNGDQS